MTRETTANTKLLNGSSGDRRRGRARIRSAAVVTALIGASAVFGVLVAQQLPSQSALALSSDVAEPSVSGPVVELVPSEVDFGEVQRGTTETMSVRLMNRGTTTATVSDIFSSCGCTVATKPTTPIAPGESATIDVRMSATGTADRKTTKMVRIRLEGSDDLLKLPVSITPIELLKAEIHFSDETAEGMIPVVLRANDEREIRILEATPANLLHADRNSTEPNAFLLDRSAWDAAGSPKEIRLDLDHPSLKTYRLNLSALIARKTGADSVSTSRQTTKSQSVGRTSDTLLPVIPHRVSFGTIRPGESATAQVLLKKTGLDDGLQTGVTWSDQFTTLEIDHVLVTEKGALVRLSLSAAEGATGDVRERAVLKLGEYEARPFIYASIGE